MDATHSVFKDIWMVDDDEDDILVFENVLKEISPLTRFTAFRSGDELLSHLTDTSPDLLVLDINMPGMNGFECLRGVRGKRTAPLPVIAYSGSELPLVIKACYQSGATLFMVKPLSLQQLSRQITALLQMNWIEADLITEAQFKADRFVPFSAE